MTQQFVLNDVAFFKKHLDAIEIFYQNNLIFHKITKDDGIILSAVELKGPHNPLHTLVIVPGRAEIEHKYAELLYNLKEANVRIVLLFVRGQGSSSRVIPQSQKCHAVSFEDYTEDLAFMLDALDIKDFIMMGFSLGGLICLDYLVNFKLKPKRLALLAPYLWPAVSLPDPLLRTLVFTAAKIPFLNTAYTSHGKDYKMIPFEDNFHSHDLFRYTVYHNYYTKYPETAHGGPTFGFVSETMKKQLELFHDNFIFKIPLLCICAGDDRVVSTPHTQKFIGKHQNDRIKPVVVSIKGAYHDLLNESDDYRSPALQKALNFLLSELIK